MPGNGLSLPILVRGQKELRTGFRFLFQPGHDGLAAGEDDPDWLIPLVDFYAQHLEERGREGGWAGGNGG